VNLDHDSPGFQAKAAALDKSKTHLVHCAAGVRSARACEKLGQFNFPSLYNLPGGFKAWAKAMRIGGCELAATPSFKCRILKYFCKR
jgi:rhodanese-related sulfurtransferase